VAASLVLHARHALALQDEAVCPRFGKHLKVGALQCRLQEGLGRAPAAAVADVHLVEAEAFLASAVEVVVERIAGLPGSFQQGLAQRMGVVGIAHGKLARAAVVGLAQAKILLRALEVGQHLFI